MKGTRNIYTIGGADQVVHVLLDPQRLAGYDIALGDLRAALSAAQCLRPDSALVTNNT